MAERPERREINNGHFYLVCSWGGQGWTGWAERVG